MIISLRPGMEKDRDEVARELIDIQYDRNDMDFHRGTFRVRGDVLEIFPADYTDTAVRVEFFGDEIDRITEINVLTGEIKCQLNHIAIFPASHYVVPMEQIKKAAIHIEEELEERGIAQPDFVYDTLVLPRATHEVVTESNGSTSTSYESIVETKAGVPFTAYVLLWNNGDDGMTTVQAICDGEVIAEKIMAVNGGDWRVVEMELTIDQPGEHTLTVGTLTKTITIVE